MRDPGLELCRQSHSFGYGKMHFPVSCHEGHPSAHTLIPPPIVNKAKRRAKNKLAVGSRQQAATFDLW
jgi:hypothetical protein